MRPLFDQILMELRGAARSLARDRAYTVTALATLALGIGATTAIFSVVYGVVLRPLPFPNAERLVQIYATPVERGEAIGFPDLNAFRANASGFAAIAGYGVSARYLRGAHGAERVMVVLAERSLFAVLASSPFVGRTFTPDEPVTAAIVSHRFWRERLGANASAVGSTINLDDEPFSVIGVMPPDFQFPYKSATGLGGAIGDSRTDLWIPMYALGQPPRGRASSVVARLKPGVGPQAAAGELSAIAAQQDALVTDPAARGRGVRLEPLADAVVSRTIKRPLFFLLGAVAMVLALVCANVMNLSLVRMTLRSREVAVRAALGAHPRRLLRQFLTESVVLSVIGGALGLGLAKVATDRLLQLVTAQLPRAHDVAFDWSVFLFMLSVGAAVGIAFGIAPALWARRTDPQAALKESGGYGTAGLAYRRLRDALVVGEVALAFVLVVGGALLVRELVRLRNVETGLISTNAMTFHLGHRMTPRTDPQQFYAIADQVAQLPQVRAAGFTQLLPLQNWGWFSTSGDFRVKGRPPATPAFQIELRYVTPGYFDALGIAMAKGRRLAVTDSKDAPRVILINEALAQRYFADEDPIGVETTRGMVVGVVRDVRQVHLDRPANPEIYFPIAQNWSQVSELGMTLVVRTDDRPEPVISAVRSIVRQVNPSFAIFNIKSFDAVITESLSGFTIYLWLMVGFAALAVVLATTGVYGVIAFVAAARTREFAIRVAVGADTARVTRLVLSHGARLAVFGTAVGIIATILTRPLLQNLPISVRPPDLTLIVPIAIFVAVIAVAACAVPALRAAHADLFGTLRNE